MSNVGHLNESLRPKSNEMGRVSRNHIVFRFGFRFCHADAWAYLFAVG